MREPPAKLSNATMLTCLRTQYGLPVANLTFLPIGHDSSAWVYQAQTDDGTAYFVKLRTGIANEAGLRLPRYLHDHGVTHVVAPLPTATQTLWASVDGYALILYPFIDGTTGMQSGMSDRQWVDYGAILRQMHATPISAELTRSMRREDFAPEWGAVTKQLDAHIGARAFADPAARELAAFWQARRPEIQMLLDRAEELGRRLARTAPPFVICHADIHTDNVLLDDGGQVWLVDWDETTLAPKERDLMFVVGGISTDLVGPREEELFFRGYGPTAIDPLGLAYYRYAWAVGDIGAFGAEVFFRPDLGAATKRAAVDSFLSLFQPGEIVSLAFASGYP